MLLSKTVFIKQNTYMKKYYESKGYPFIKRGYIMEVKVEDLPETSNANVDTICDFCGKPHKMKYCKYLGAKDKGICCYQCRQKKTMKTNLEKYGVENASQLEEVKQKRKKTCIERYGAVSNLCTEETKAKIKKTCIEKYGCEYASQSQESIEKRKQTSLERYGTENPLQNEEVKAKLRKALYQNGTCPSSKAQRHICNVLNGELNFPVGFYNLDIYLGNNIYVEYDGSGHGIQVKFGHMTQAEFNKKEENRFLYLLDKGYKMIKLINTSIKPSDKLPTDSAIKQIVDDGIKYINQGGNAYIINLENFEVTYK